MGFITRCLMVLLPLFITGCACLTGVDVQARLEDKARVDQDVSGNAGYLAGRPEVVETPVKESRKVMVVEITPVPTIDPVQTIMDIDAWIKKNLW